VEGEERQGGGEEETAALTRDKTEQKVEGIELKDYVSWRSCRHRTERVGEERAMKGERKRRKRRMV
jgi:hypothetical protein